VGTDSTKGEGTYFIGNGVEESVDDALREATFLVLVQLDDLAPIRSHFGKVKTLGKVNEVKDVLLEARATKADRCPQKFGPNPRIPANSVGNFLNVGPRRFADSRERVDGRDTLGQHRIGGQFGQFRGPEANSQDAVSPA
jgi:hypothetical protein